MGFQLSLSTVYANSMAILYRFTLALKVSVMGPPFQPETPGLADEIQETDSHNQRKDQLNHDNDSMGDKFEYSLRSSNFDKRFVIPKTL